MNTRSPLPAFLEEKKPENASSTSLGAQLTRARQRAGVSREAAARTTSIPLHALEALEEDRLNDLPADVYTKGFLKLYAEYLHIDAETLLGLYHTQRLSRVPHNISGPQPLRKQTHLSFSWGPKTALLLFGGILVCLACIYLFFEVRGFTRAPRLTVTDPNGDIELSSSSLVVKGTTDPTADVHINGERVFVDSHGAFQETVDVGSGVNTIRVTATSVGGKERIVERHILNKESASPSPTSLSTSLPSPQATEGAFSFRVQADGAPVWVSLSANGKNVFQGVLAANDHVDATGTTMTISSGKANRTRITIDGQDRGPLAATSGAVQNSVFTRSSASGTVEQQHP